MGSAFIGLADDYSAVYWNPPGLIQLNGMSIRVFVTDVIPTTTFQFDMMQIDATSVRNHTISGVLAFFLDLNEKMKNGIYADVPSGLGSLWDGDDLAAYSGPAGAAFEWMSKKASFALDPPWFIR